MDNSDLARLIEHVSNSLHREISSVRTEVLEYFAAINKELDRQEKALETLFSSQSV